MRLFTSLANQNPSDCSQPGAGMERILVIEDDRAVQRALKRLFESEGYAIQSGFDGPSGLEAFRTAPPDVVVLDLRLPGISGSDVCRSIKESAPSLPVVVLSAAADVADKVLLLELGADDYVTKPFSPRELLARVRVAIRRSSHNGKPEVLAFADISVDFTRMQVTRDGRPVPCTRQEFKILKFFAANQASSHARSCSPRSGDTTHIPLRAPWTITSCACGKRWKGTRSRLLISRRSMALATSS